LLLQQHCIFAISHVVNSKASAFSLFWFVWHILTNDLADLFHLDLATFKTCWLDEFALKNLEHTLSVCASLVRSFKIFHKALKYAGNVA